MLLISCVAAAGKADVWQYWFEHFTKQYEGLPGLGKLEDIYKQHDVSSVLFSSVNSRLGTVGEAVHATCRSSCKPSAMAAAAAAATAVCRCHSAQMLLSRLPGYLIALLSPCCVSCLQEEARAKQLRELQVHVERPPREPQVDQFGRAAALGGRKTSSARVRHRQGVHPQQLGSVVSYPAAEL